MEGQKGRNKVKRENVRAALRETVTHTDILPVASHSIVIVCPSTTVISVVPTVATGAPGCPTTMT